jgi:hypothetical protein
MPRNQIVYDLQREVGGSYRHELFLFDPVKGVQRRLFETDVGRHFSPSFSAATQRLGITHYEPCRGGKDLRERILFLGLDREEPARLSAFDSHDIHLASPTFNLDGTMLAVELSHGMSHNPDVYILEIITEVLADMVFGSVRAVISNPLSIGIHLPRFFPDGSRLVYLRNYAHEDALEVCFADLSQDGVPESELEKVFGSCYRRRLTNNADVVWHRPHALALEPRSDTAFFIRGHYRFEHEQICAVSCRADAEEDPWSAVSITESFERIGGIFLAPDGNQLAFIGDGQLFVAARDGGDLLPVTTAEEVVSCAVFSPDSQEIAFVRAEGGTTPGLYVIDRFARTEAELLLSPGSGSVSELLWI